MAKKYHHEVKLVKLSEIRANKYNPNVVPDAIMEQLVKRIKEEGFLQPVLLRNIPPEGEVKYEVIDGEHRYLAAEKTGDYEEIPAIVLDKNLPEAMLSTINMNKLRGEFDTLKLAEVIHQLHETYSIEELEEKLGYSAEEQTGMENLLQYDFNQLGDEGVTLDDENEGEEQEFKLILTAKQMKIVNDALEMTGKEDNVDSLITICLEYLAHHGKKNAKE